MLIDTSRSQAKLFGSTAAQPYLGLSRSHTKAARAPQRSATGVVHLRHEGAGQAERLRDHGAPIDALAPAAAGPGAPIEDLLKLLDELDTWLAPYGDRPAAGAFLAWRTPALKESKKVDAAVFDAGRQYLGTAIVSHFECRPAR